MLERFFPPKTDELVEVIIGPLKVAMETWLDPDGLWNAKARLGGKVYTSASLGQGEAVERLRAVLEAALSDVGIPTSPAPPGAR